MTRSTPAWRNFLFDFDGTLVDSSPLHDRAYRFALARHRPELLPKFSYDTVKSMTTREGFRALGVSDAAAVETLTTEKQREFRAEVARGALEVFPGVRDTLAYLAQAGRRLFVVSAGSRASVTAALAATGLAPHFAGFITADEVAHGKPAPDAFLACLARFGLVPEETVVIEDAPVGIAAARAAGLAVIALHEAGLAADADYRFPNFPALHAWLTKTRFASAPAS